MGLTAATVLGALFAVAVSRLWALDDRWFVVTCTAIAMLSFSLFFIGRLADYLFVLLIASFPLAGISKWLFVDWLGDEQKGNILYSGAIGIGPVDFILAGLALTWLWDVFVLRTQPLPRLRPLDGMVAMIVVSYLVSLPGAPEPVLGLFSLTFLLKHIFVYFYLAHHVDEKRLNWVIIGILVAIVLEALLGTLQSQFGILEGFARDKGAGDSERREQYEVPGIETLTRAEGTAYDSHALALAFSMLLPAAAVMAFNPRWPASGKMACVAAFMLGVAGLVLTFSRSGWISFALSGAVLLFGIVLFRWRATRIVPLLFLLPLLALIAAPWAYNYIHERFTSAPNEIMTARFEQWEVAFEIWKNHPWFGYGVGNYMEAVRVYNFDGALELPVHNVALWIAAESGLFGVIAFFGFIFALEVRLWRIADDPGDPNSLAAAAFFTAVLAYVLDGLTNPLFREPLVHMIFWMVAGLSGALVAARERAQSAPRE